MGIYSLYKWRQQIKMITTDDFAFIHMPKTGGQFVRNILLKYREDAKEIGIHFPRKELPQGAKDLPIFGFVRNPWAWYVSWYNYFLERVGTDQQNMYFDLFSQKGSKGFKSTIQDLLIACDGDGIDASNMYSLLQSLTQKYNDRQSVTISEDMLCKGQGFYSLRFNMLFESDSGDTGGIHFGKTENLRADLVDIFQQLNVPLALDMRCAIESQEKVNTSKDVDYRAYYDEEVYDMVANKEKSIIERFSYTF